MRDALRASAAALLLSLATAACLTSLADAVAPGCEGDACCVPESCEEHHPGVSGSFDDGCGAPLDCRCGDDEYLLEDGVTCAPCACSAGDCGARPVSCGAIDCGVCPGPDVCGGGGVPRRCGCTPVGNAARCAGRCGELLDCQELVACGGCGVGSCSPGPGLCVAEPRPFCWDAPVAWTELVPPPGEFIYGVLVVEDGDGLAGYAQVGNSDGTFLGRFPLADDGFSVRGPYEPLDQLVLPGYRSAVVPTVRSDGLELIFRTVRLADSASRALVSTRASPRDPWGSVRDLELPIEGEFFSLVLLDDHRTLLVSAAAAHPGRAVVLRRPTTVAGSGGFEPVGSLRLDDFSDGTVDRVGGLSYGCQRDALLFTAQPEEPHDHVRLVSFVDLDLPEIGEPAVVDLLEPIGPDGLPTGLFGHGIEVPTESPGCGQLQLSVQAQLYRSVRRQCP